MTYQETDLEVGKKQRICQEYAFLKLIDEGTTGGESRPPLLAAMASMFDPGSWRKLQPCSGNIILSE